VPARGEQHVDAGFLQQPVEQGGVEGRTEIARRLAAGRCRTRFCRDVHRTLLRGSGWPRGPPSGGHGTVCALIGELIIGIINDSLNPLVAKGVIILLAVFVDHWFREHLGSRA
jgi:hypothetical protein